MRVKCFVHTFYNYIGGCQSEFKCMKRPVMCRIRVFTTFKGHSCLWPSKFIFCYLGRGSTRVVTGGGDVNGLQKHINIVL